MAGQEKLRICLASSEVAPLAKTGGLADVAAALPAYLHRQGHDVRVLMPYYRRVDNLGLAIEPVLNLQGIAMRIGPWDVEYSIDVTTVPNLDLPVYLLRCPWLYGRDGVYTQDSDEHLRFVVLSRAAIEMCQRMRFAPHVFHCHDWHTALIPLFLRSVYAWDALFAETRSVLTIHNIGYQGVFPAEFLPDLGLGDATNLLHQDDLGAGRINFLKTGVMYADLLTTVSPTYAREIQGVEYGMGLDSLLRERADVLFGILNGVDYGEWDPAIDAFIPENYSPDDLAGKAHCKLELMQRLGLPGGARQPLLGIVSRLVSQKGIELVQAAVPRLLAERQFSLAVLGSGAAAYERFFSQLQDVFRDRVCYYRGFNERLAHWIEAGADMFLMPSLYEPCGLNQLYSLKYGTVPIVRDTGGLADSVEQVDAAAGTGTGVKFRDYDAVGLRWAMNRALDLYDEPSLWGKIIANGMAMNFSWENQGSLYVELFRRLSKLS